MPARHLWPLWVLCGLLGACVKTPGSTDAGSDGGPAGSPGAPVLSATSAASPAAVQLAWMPADALATGFQVERAESAGTFLRIAQLSGTATRYTDTALEPGRPYAYRVSGSNDAGNGAASNVIDLLAAPADLAAAGSDTRMVLTWSPIDGADSYAIYRLPDAGALELLGASASASFLDDGGVLPIRTGASYAYQVVSSADGGALPSIGSNLASGRAFGLDVTANAVFISDVGEETLSLDTILLLEARNLDGGPLVDDAGDPIVFQSVGIEGAIVVPGVPDGTYAITVQGYRDYAVTSARAVDFSQAVAGRSDLEGASSGTQLVYSLSGLAPWTSAADGGIGDALEEICLGADDHAADLSLDIATPPDAGQSLFAGVETLGQDSDGNLIDADAGDVLHLVQLHVQSSSNDLPYRAPAAVFSPPGFSTADGASSTIAGTLAATAPISIAALEFPRSAWLDLGAASQNPAAQSPAQRLSIRQEKGYLAHGWYSNDSLVDGLLLEIPQDGGAAESDGGVVVEAGALHWAEAAPQSWDAFALIESTVEVPFQLSFIDTTLSPPQTVSATQTFTARSTVAAPLDGTSLPANILVPALGAPRAPLLDGTSLFAAQAGVSPTATLSWSAPALGAPLYYQVVIYQIVPETNADGSFVQDANGNYLLQFTEAASFTTHDLFVSLAADLVEPGQSYFATLAAVDDSGLAGPIDGTTQPYLFGQSSSAALTVTASFTIAGTVAPATRRRSRPERFAPTRPPGLQRRLWRAPLLRP